MVNYLSVVKRRPHAQFSLRLCSEKYRKNMKSSTSKPELKKIYEKKGKSLHKSGGLRLLELIPVSVKRLGVYLLPQLLKLYRSTVQFFDTDRRKIMILLVSAT